MFVDHASGAVHVEHQVALTTHETLQSKHRYKEKARDCGVIVQNYLSDNGTAFSSADFAKDLARFCDESGVCAWQQARFWAFTTV